MQHNTTYYWQVVPFNLTGEAVDCPVWTFTTIVAMPQPVTYLSPANNAIFTENTVTLEWVHNENNVSLTGYRLFLGTTNPPPFSQNLSNNITSSIQNLYSGTWYWQVVPYNQAGDVVNAPIWSFSIVQLPPAAIYLTPQNNQTSVSINPTLSWYLDSGGGDVQGVYIHFGTTNPPPQVDTIVDEERINAFRTGLGLGTSWSPPSLLNYETTYHWQIVPFNIAGIAVNQPIWSFTTLLPLLPDEVINRNPPNNAVGVPLNQILSWSPAETGGTPTGYNIYFGNSFPLPLVESNWSQTSWTPPDLQPQTEYSWRIVAINSAGSGYGSTFVFTTTSPAGIIINPTSIEFGTITIGLVSEVQNFTITNDGGSPLIIEDIIGSVNSTHFNISHSLIPITINAGSSANVSVSFEPMSPGSINSTINIFHNAQGSPHQVALSGIAVSPVFSPPSNVQVTYQNNAVDINWESPMPSVSTRSTVFSQYRLLRNGALLTTLTNTSYTDNSVIPDNQYVYSVIAEYANPEGESIPVNSPAIIVPIFNPVNNLQANLSGLTVSVIWMLPNQQTFGSVVAYNISRNGNHVSTTTNLFYNDTNISAGIELVYTIIVEYSNPDGVSIEQSTSLTIPDFGIPVQLNIELYDRQANLTWNAPTPPYFGTLVGYRIYRNQEVLENHVTDNYFTDSDLTYNVSYTYHVKAIYMNPAGESLPSNEVTIIPQELILPPKNLNYTIVDQTNVLLNWEIDAPAQPIAYNVFRNNMLLTINPISETNYTDPNRLLDTQYNYAVSAVYTTGESTQSEIDVIVPIYNPPRNLVAVSGLNATVELTWEAPLPQNYGELIGYNLYRDGEFKLSIVNSQLSIDTDLQYDIEYTFHVTAIWGGDIDGESLASNTAIITLIEDKLPPTNLSFEIVTYNVILSWTPPEANYLGFNIYRRLLLFPDDVIHLNQNELITENTFTDFNIPATGLYQYCIYAEYVSGTSEAACIEVDFMVNDTPIENKVFQNKLLGNYPNPFNPETQIHFSTEADTYVNIDIYNIRGQKIITLVNRFFESGEHSVLWNGKNELGRDVGSGVYLINMRTENYVDIKRMVLMK